MKVIGGQAKGRKLFVPREAQLRITSDRTKESLFNILPSVKGKVFLDIFAGSGNVGIEAMSRGAARVVFVEENVTMVTAITKNISSCGFREKYDVIKKSFDKGIRLLAKREETFDIIFADPPYEKGLVNNALDTMSKYELIAEGGVIIFEHSFREKCKEEYESIVLKDQRRYGDTMLSFFLINCRGRE